MIRFIRSLIAVTAALTMGATAAPTEAQPSPQVAKRLISDMLNINASTIRIASIVEGSDGRDDAFERRWMCQVTAVLPVIESGRMVRRVRDFSFEWNPLYGWFYQEVAQTRGGEQVWIWSEKKGEITIR